MKILIIFLASLSAFGFASATIAAPPGKANILHCGCVVDATGAVGMAYVAASVSSKARGHLKHIAGSVDSCFDGVSTYVDFQRTGSDCQVSGTPLAGLPQCAAEAAGGICGQPAPEQ